VQTDNRKNKQWMAPKIARSNYLNLVTLKGLRETVCCFLGTLFKHFCKTLNQAIELIEHSHHESRTNDKRTNNSHHLSQQRSIRTTMAANSTTSSGILGYVGEKQYRFVAGTSHSFHQVYLDTFRGAIWTSMRNAAASVSCAEMRLHSEESGFDSNA
jgi:hypothetical protein